MLTFLKNRTKTLLNLAGFEIRRWRPATQRFKWLVDLNIGTVIDVGANIGQFSKEIRELLPNARIYAFEPLADCYAALSKEFEGDQNLKFYNLALCNQNGEVSFHRSASTASSSMLPMADLHKENFPFTSYVGVERVRAARLDDMSHEIAFIGSLLVKIDVQGAEGEVIAGGVDTIRAADVVFIENSFQPLYEGARLFKDILDFFYDNGFRYMGNMGGHLYSPANGSCLCEDSIFVNTRLIDRDGRLKGSGQQGEHV